MAKKIVIRRMGQTMKEGTVAQWLVENGSAVKTGQPIYVLEYDKASVEVEAPCDGTIHLIAEEGAVLPVGETVAEVLEAGEAPSAQSAAPSEAAGPVTESASAVKEYGVSAAAKRLIRQNGLDLSKIVPANGRRIMPDDVKAYMSAAAASPQQSTVKATPLAAKVAADLGIDLSRIDANGRVFAEDILRSLSSGGSVSGAAPAVREEAVPMSGMRKVIARNMLNSHMTSPTVTFNISVDMTEAKRFREQLKANDIKVSYTDLLVKFVAKALTEFPLLNCSVEDNKIIYKHYVNIGVAVALDNGLVVPNVTDADKKSLTQISAELRDLAAQARSGSLPVDKLSGGTFTITNLGMYGIESFSPIINQPEVAILGVNAIEDKAVVRSGEIVIRPILQLSLTADHRVVDGAVAAQFLQRVKALLESPALMIA